MTIKYDRDAGKQFEIMDRISGMGKTKVEIECPHCQEQFWGYVWSIAGGGKKCPGCGAMHVNSRWAYPVMKGDKQ